MRPPATTSLRLTVAIVASAALHAGAAYVATAVPYGAPQGVGPLLARPLHVRILGVRAPPVEPKSSTPPDVGVHAPVPGRAPIARTAPAAPIEHAGSAASPQPVAPLGLREPPLYYVPSQLDVRPRLLTRVEPAYPQGAPPDGGYVVLRLLIGEDGRVERAIVVISDPDEKFGAAAAAAFAEAQFSSGKLNGVTVKSQLMIEMKFASLLPPGVAGLGAGSER